ncbi:MAG: cytochrome c oxidase assembly factor Coa1 family protein [Planctomycetota bacterium]
MSNANDPFASGTQPGTPPTKSGSTTWIWVLGGVLILVPLLCCGVLGAVGYIGAQALTAPIDEAVVALADDPRVTGRLGTPIKSGSGFGIKQYENNNGNGGASVDFNATGPEGSAHVTGRMQLIAGVWSPEDLTVRFDDGETIQLPNQE